MRLINFPSLVIKDTLFKKFEISFPNAPAFITSAPPSVPGTPIKLSSPVRFLFVLFLTKLPSITPDSAKMIFSLKSNFLKDFLGEITIPLIPLSETNRFDPEPIKYVGIEFCFE